MTSTNERISSLTQRREEVERELADILASKGQTENAALKDLESCLHAEIEKIDRQLKQFRDYLSHVDGASDQTGS